jgi:hypothetical protein
MGDDIQRLAYAVRQDGGDGDASFIAPGVREFVEL